MYLTVTSQLGVQDYTCLKKKPRSPCNKLLSLFSVSPKLHFLAIGFHFALPRSIHAQPSFQPARPQRNFRSENHRKARAAVDLLVWSWVSRRNLTGDKDLSTPCGLVWTGRRTAPSVITLSQAEREGRGAPSCLPQHRVKCRI